MAKKDISKKIVLVMLVIAIVLSVTGTWLVLDNLENSITRGYLVSSESTGNVKLGIIGEKEPNTATASSSGNVKLVIE